MSTKENIEIITKAIEVCNQTIRGINNMIKLGNTNPLNIQILNDLNIRNRELENKLIELTEPEAEYLNITDETISKLEIGTWVRENTTLDKYLIVNCKPVELGYELNFDGVEGHPNIRAFVRKDVLIKNFMLKVK
ncbi:MAG: hypothetical protein ACKOXB_10165 [Flavobacteriales bacterium]